MKKVKKQPLNPYQRGVLEHNPSLAFSTGQYVSAALGLTVLPMIEPEQGENVFAMWLRAMAERGKLWESLSLQDQQGVALDLYFACMQRAISFLSGGFLKACIPPLSEEEFEASLLPIKVKCGFEE